MYMSKIELPSLYASSLCVKSLLYPYGNPGCFRCSTRNRGFPYQRFRTYEIYRLGQHERSCSLKAAYLYWNISVQAAVVVQQHVLFIWAHVSISTAGMVLLSQCSDQLRKNVCSHGGCFDASMLLMFSVWLIFQLWGFNSFSFTQFQSRTVDS